MGMKTYDGFIVVFTEGLFELQGLNSHSPIYYEKEQQLGRFCYEAEEHLFPTELRLLKATLGLNDGLWRSYKSAFVEGNSWLA
jgi:hypothetical protein